MIPSSLLGDQESGEDMLKGVLFGLLAGAIGAAIWALVSWKTGYEIGWIAVGIGFLVGVAVAQGERSAMAGVIAVVLSVLAVAAGKYAAGSLMLGDFLSADGELPAEVIQDFRSTMRSEQEFVGFLADSIALERTENGETLDWPSGMDYETAYELDHYPVDVQNEARRQYAELDEAERNAIIEDEINMMQTYVSAGASSAMRTEVFKNSWGPMDLLFMGIAIFAAFRAAATPAEG